MIGIASNNGYGAAYAYPYSIRFGGTARSANVPPVTPVSPVSTVGRQPNALVTQPNEVTLPAIRKGVDPVEMAVRGRIQYVDPSQVENTASANTVGNTLDREQSKAAHETMQEGECQTCENRKYQDGSNDPGVSFKTATRLTPEQAATAVRGHEMEHVSHERARAEREDRKVVQQSVTIHTAICPECGDVYISGGTTRTTTAKDNSQEMFEQARQQMLGRTLDTIA